MDGWIGWLIGWLMDGSLGWLMIGDGWIGGWKDGLLA